MGNKSSINIQGNVERSVIIDGDRNIVVLTFTDKEGNKTTSQIKTSEPILPDVENWFGRETELDDLCRKIQERESKLIAITGQGGSGKSALVAKLLEELVKRKEIFEFTTWYSFRNRPTFDEAIDYLINDVTEKILQDTIRDFKPEQKINFLIHLLNQKRCLIVLDNLETLFDIESEGKVGRFKDPNYSMLLKALSESSHLSQIILTSRERPTDVSNKTQDFQQYPPSGLSGIDSAFAIKLLRSQGLVGTDGEFKTIADNYDGHPLALILVSGLIIEDYERKIERLNSEHLVIEGIDDLLEEQFKRLSEQEQKLLGQISVFREAITIDALVAVSKQSQEEIREITKKLRRRSLLQYEFVNEVETYDMHPMIKEYAYKSFKNKAGTHRSAYDYYISQDLKTREERRTLSDVKSLNEAHYHACSSGEYDQAFDVIFDNNLHYDLDLWGYSNVLVELYEKLLPRDYERGEKKLSDLGNHEVVLGNLGLAYNILGEVDKAISYLEQALVIAREIGDKSNEGNWLGSLGDAYRSLGEEDKAISYYEQALGIARETGDKRNEGNCLGSLGNAYNRLGKVDKAISHYEQALGIAREIEDKRNEGTWLGNLGVAYKSLGKVGKAIFYYEQALGIAREIGDKSGEGTRLGNLGNAYHRLGEVDKAISYYEEEDKIAKEFGNK